MAFALIMVFSQMGYGIVYSASAQETEADIVVDANGGGDYASIQKAVNSAKYGDTIYVRKGEYSGEIIINKKLTLRGGVGSSEVGPGPSAPVITGQGNNESGIILASGSSNSVIKGFEIRNFSFDNGSGGRGITFHGNDVQNVVIRDNFIHNIGWTAVVAAPTGTANASNYTVANNRISDFAAFGIRLANVDQSQITSNQIKGTDGWPKWQNSTSSAVGILIEAKLRTDSTFNVTDIRVADNSISGPLWTGIAVNSWNTLSESSVNLRMVNVESNVVVDSRITRGIGVGSQGEKATITNTRAIDNRISVGNFGIGVFEYNESESANVRVERNHIKAGEVGLYTWRTAEEGEITVVRNQFGQSEIGVLVPNNTTAIGTALSGNSFGNQSEYGAINNGTGILNATHNWWGDASGPSSPTTSIVEDPVTGTVANGSGDAVSGSIHFDPWLETTPEGPGDVTGNGDSATDPDGDGTYEDLTGDTSVDTRDILALWNHRKELSPQYFDFTNDGSVDARDVLELWKQRDSL